MYFKKKLLTLSLLLLTLVTTGCIQKQTNGKYYSKYSYHPYYKLYKNKMATKNKRYKVQYSYQDSKDNYFKEISPTKHAYKEVIQRVKHRVKYNDENLYPSNVPANSNY